MTHTTGMRQGPPPQELLLAAANFEERRLFFAELMEAGYEVMPVPGLIYVVRALRLRVVAPSLILVDALGDQHATPRDVEHLLALAPGVPVILVVGAMEITSWEPLRSRVTALLRRPITIGEVVDAVRRTLPLNGRAL
jgi:hypothetical protein